MLIRKLGTFY